MTFTKAAEEWLHYVEHDRGRKPSTISGYRALLNSQLLPVFGEKPIESITTPEIEAWIGSVDRSPATRTKALVLMHGIFKRAKKVYGLPLNPVAEVEKPADRAERRYRGLLGRGGHGAGPRRRLRTGRRDLPDRRLHRPAPRRAAGAALAGRGFRGPGHPLRASYADGALTTPKSGKVRSVPMAPDVAEALAKLSQRERWTADDDLVFGGRAGNHLDGRALRRRP